MSKPNITCRVCGGSEFAAESGFFFCLECNTQSQDVREEVFEEYLGNQKISSRVLQKKLLSQTKADENTKLTTWEILNYVLKGITDVLIDLGASPELKIVTLQLWASYLRSLEIAFTSVEVERRPKLGFAFKWRDAEIVFGVTPKQLSSKSWRSRSRTSSMASSRSSGTDSETSATESGTNQSRRSILRRLAIRKKALASAEYSKMSKEMSMSMSQTLDGLDSSTGIAETPKRLKITKRAKSLLSMSPAGSDDDKMSYRKQLSRSEVHSLRNVTTSKVVAVINIAMALTQQEIQISDFLRWVDEGHISLATSKKFLPRDLKMDGLTKRMLEVEQLSYTKCQNLIMGMCNELEITQLPAPDVGRLVERYFLELQLPGDLIPLVKRLLSMTVNSDSKHPVHQSKSWEVRIMSAIVVVVKMMFSLDDCTEYRLSHTAAEINRASQEEGDPKNLFVFTKWMQYIECRKAVVSYYHLPTRKAVYGDSVGKDPTLFLQHSLQTDYVSNKQEVKNRYELNKNWVEAVGRCLQQLCDSQPVECIEFPASLTPLHSSTQVLLSQHAEVVEAVRTILAQDFTLLSLEHILKPESITILGLTLDLNILQRDQLANDFIVKDHSFEEESLIIPRNGINTMNFAVKIVKDVVTEVSEKIDETNVEIIEKTSVKHQSKASDFSEILSDDSDDEDIESGFCDAPQPDVSTCHTTLELFKTGAQYWFCHNLRKKCSNLEFETFATNALPTTFLWFLRECARVVQVPTRDLYTNIVSMEENYKYIVNGK